VEGREAIVEAEMGSQMLDRMRGCEGWWRVEKWRARVFWDLGSMVWWGSGVGLVVECVDECLD